MVITDWQREAYATNVAKGFYDYQNDIKIVDTLLSLIVAAEQQGIGLHVSMETYDALYRIMFDYRRAVLERKLLLAIGELVEAHDELRNNHRPEEVYYSGQGKPEGFGTELADAVIRTMDLAAASGVDLESRMEEKHEYNQTRPYKHGRQF